MESNSRELIVLKTIADDTRLSILYALRSGPLTVTEIEKATGKSHSTTSQQLKRMMNANLLVYRQQGTQKFYEIRDHLIFDLLESIKSFTSTTESTSSKEFFRGEQVLLMGLDKSGKTSILLSFLGNKNLLSFLNANLKSTHGHQHQSAIASSMNLEIKSTSKSIFYEYGGQIVFREQFKKNPKEVIKGFDKIIFVLDVQADDRYEESLNYLEYITAELEKIYPNFKLDIFLHKFDPDIDEEKEPKYSRENINSNLIDKIKTMIPVNFQYTIYKTSIFTIFQKTMLMQTYQN